jgi:hypothetical protein
MNAVKNLRIDMKIDLIFNERTFEFHQFSHKSDVKFRNFVSFLFDSSQLSIVEF